MKSKEELNALKEEVKTVKEKLSALTDEELEQVTGGVALDFIRHGEHVLDTAVDEKQLGFELFVHTYDGPELRD